MTDRSHKLSLARQAALLGISRSSLYYEPRPVSDGELKLMHRIDELHMDYPFAGSRMMKGLLRQEGFTAGRLHVATCMKRMGIQALYRRPNTSKPAPGHKVYPYLLPKLSITRPNQVWAMRCPGSRCEATTRGDITYTPMARGFVYLIAVLDWFSRKVFAWRLSTTLETGPCIEALKDAMRSHGKPAIMNTDQGSQFTSIDFIKTLKDVDIQISMDGKGAWRDNVFVERLWRTIKYEEVYLRAYDSVTVAHESLRRYLAFYNARRPHSSLHRRTPDQAYLPSPQPIPVAA
jgi:putative transposase